MSPAQRFDQACREIERIDEDFDRTYSTAQKAELYRQRIYWTKERDAAAKELQPGLFGEAG